MRLVIVTLMLLVDDHLLFEQKLAELARSVAKVGVPQHLMVRVHFEASDLGLQRKFLLSVSFFRGHGPHGEIERELIGQEA